MQCQHYTNEPNDSITPSFEPAAVTLASTPALIRTAYNVTPVAPTGDHRQVVITIVIGYHYAGLQADFNTFCDTYQLPRAVLDIYTFPGAGTDAKWAAEECLDVQWSYALNPNAKIRVIEAVSSSEVDMYAAVNYASDPGNGPTDIISMSWGKYEFSYESTFDVYFNNPTICYLAATGDNVRLNYPAISPNVLACGGTSLYYDKDVRKETTWNVAGTGESEFISKPSYQTGVVALTNYINRCAPDVSATANPQYGVNVYYSGNNGFLKYGGTSVATPVIAGMLSNLIQSLINYDVFTTTPYYYITTVADPMEGIISLQNFMYKMIYPNSTLYSQCFNDILSGMDGSYNATTGYDIPTGLGSFNCGQVNTAIINAFSGGVSEPTKSFTTAPTFGPMVGGTTITITGSNTTFISKKTVVKINNVLCTKVVVLSATKLTCITPKNNTVGGAYDITININNGSAITLTNGFTYSAIPKITSIYPLIESLNAPLTNVTITGSGFLTGAKVLFGSVASKSVTVVNSTTITALPPRPSTTSKTTKVAIQITNSDKQSVKLNNAFTYSKATPTPKVVLQSLFSSLKRIQPTTTGSIKEKTVDRIMAVKLTR